MTTTLRLLIICLMITLTTHAQNTGYAAFSKLQYIDKVVSTSDNGYVAIGRIGQKGFVMKLNPNYALENIAYLFSS
jgi:hypothetical protein